MSTRIYTRTGDDGTTGLGGGGRVSKAAPRIDCYGTIDELNSCLGVARAIGLSAAADAALGAVQNELFHIGSELSMPDAADNSALPRVEERHLAALESAIDELSAELAPLTNFILPGGTAAAAQLHVARTVCRRAERLLVALHEYETVRATVLRYLNRLSDLLFVVARHENSRGGIADIVWDSEA